jgi:hypothetical protein
MMSEHARPMSTAVSEYVPGQQCQTSTNTPNLVEVLMLWGDLGPSGYLSPSVPQRARLSVEHLEPADDGIARAGTLPHCRDYPQTNLTNDSSDYGRRFGRRLYYPHFADSDCLLSHWNPRLMTKNRCWRKYACTQPNVGAASGGACIPFALEPVSPGSRPRGHPRPHSVPEVVIFELAGMRSGRGHHMDLRSRYDKLEAALRDHLSSP